MGNLGPGPLGPLNLALPRPIQHNLYLQAICCAADKFKLANTPATYIIDALTK